MSRKGGWTLSEEEAKKFQEGTEEVINNNVKLMVYNEYVESQKKAFISIMNFVNARINNMNAEGKISDFVQIRARIKAAESAINNDGDKALDDTFGIEIITATEEEITTIIRNLAPYMIKTKCKNHDKPNGYKAKHKYWTFKKDKIEYLKEQNMDYEQNIPMIEFQFKTSKVHVSCNTGPASHQDYKGIKREDIQRKYDEGGFNVFNTPFMWVSNNGEMTLLSEEETLKKLYPFLNTNSKRGMNR